MTFSLNAQKFYYEHVTDLPLYDSDAQAWFDATEADFKPYQKIAVNNFVIGLKADGLWDKITAFYLLKDVMRNNYSPYWKYNLKDPRDLDEAYRLTYINNNATVVKRYLPAYLPDNYYTFANTHFVFTEDYRTSKHLMFYNSTTDSAVIGGGNDYNCEIGESSVQNGVINALSSTDMIDVSDPVGIRYYLGENIGNQYDPPKYTKTHILSRTDADYVTLIRENEILVDNGVAPIVNADNGTPIYLYAGRGKRAKHDIWFASIGYGFTKSEMLAYSTRIQELAAKFVDLEYSADQFYIDATTGFPGEFETYENDFVSIKKLTANGLPLRLLAQRDSIKIGTVAGEAIVNPFPNDFYISSDNGKTWGVRRWTNGTTYPGLARTFHIFENHKIIFSTIDNRLWKSDDLLQTITEVTLQNADGTPYVYHTPVNPLYPGNYFNRWTISETGFINGVEMFIWGNWGNGIESKGASPTNIYYSYGGDSVKVAYVFGQGWRDNGTAAGSATSGTPLGDPLNPVAVYHAHSVTYNQIDTSFWCSTGEEGAAARWMRGKYDAATDSWTWESRARGDVNGAHVRSSGLWFRGDSTYWVSDAYQSGYSGIFRIKNDDVMNLTNSTIIHPIVGDAGSSLTWGDTIVSGRAAASADRTIYYSNNGGRKWYVITPYPQKYSIKSSPWFYPDSDGWFAFGYYGSYRGDAYLIKFKF
jgi:hypothetical protein